MKKILFIGDSIMYGAKGVPGYGYFVKQHFVGSTEVILPYDNCQDVRYTYQFLDELFDLDDIKTADIIHWNNGLWDVLHFAGAANPYTELSLYVTSVEKLYKKLRSLNPTAQIVFATTTFIHEELQTKKSYRRNDEIEEYNRTVIDAFINSDVRINYLCDKAKEIDSSFIGKDGLHYTVEGASRLAEYVIEYLSNFVK